MQKNIFIKRISFYLAILLLALGIFTKYTPLVCMNINEETIRQLTQENQKLKAMLQAFESNFFKDISNAETTEKLLDIITMSIKNTLRKAPKIMTSFNGTLKETNTLLYIAISYVICLCIEILIDPSMTTEEWQTYTTINEIQKNKGSYCIRLPLYSKNQEKNDADKIYIIQFLINTKNLDHKYNKKYTRPRAHPTYPTHVWNINITIPDENTNETTKKSKKNDDSTAKISFNHNVLKPNETTICATRTCKLISPEIKNNILTKIPQIIYDNAQMSILLNFIINNTTTQVASINQVKTIPYREHFFHILLFYLYKILGNEVETETTAGQGKIDLLVNRYKNPIIIEVKYKQNTGTALKQIINKQYTNVVNNNKIIIMGININDITQNNFEIKIQNEDIDGTTSPYLRKNQISHSQPTTPLDKMLYY